MPDQNIDDAFLLIVIKYQSKGRRRLVGEVVDNDKPQVTSIHFNICVQ